MGNKALRKAVRKSANRDEYANGTVVRWTTGGRYNYAAIKTDAGWYTTASQRSWSIDKVITFDELLEIAGRSDTTDVMVATEWTRPGGDK